VRIVLDTNVIVSAYVFPGGPPEEILSAVLKMRLQLIVSRPLLLEVGRILQEKFRWEPSHAQAVIAQLLQAGELVKPSIQVSDIEADPTDNRVLEAASEGKAEVIVSGDKHLLLLDSWRGIRILKPRTLLEELD
jgi:uncharacterized protein